MELVQEFADAVREYDRLSKHAEWMRKTDRAEQASGEAMAAAKRYHRLRMRLEAKVQAADAQHDDP